jgi:SAM-dependent methyltransferase
VPSRGEQYEARFATLAQQGRHLHGEADLVDALAGGPPATVVDAGCGTGRVAIELARRGYGVVGIDVDLEMLDVARAKAPNLDWRLDDLSDPAGPLPQGDVVVAAGNVLLFVAPGTEPAVVATWAACLAPNGILVAGFQLRAPLTVDGYDVWCERAGLVLVGRWSTWDRQPFEGGEYAVSLHRRRPDALPSA